MLTCPRCRSQLRLRDVYWRPRRLQKITCRACGASLRFGTVPLLFLRLLQAALMAAFFLCLERTAAQPLLGGVALGALLTIAVLDLMFISFTALREIDR